MLPPPATPAALIRPRPAPLPVFAGRLSVKAGRSLNHVSGEVRGARVLYADLHAAAWFTAGGWELRNRRGLSGRARALEGMEDTNHVRR